MVRLLDRRDCPTGLLQVSIEAATSGVDMTVGGELDLATGPVLVAAAAGIDWADWMQLDLDLEHTSFVDCAGLRALRHVVTMVEGQGCGIAIVDAGPGLSRLGRALGHVGGDGGGLRWPESRSYCSRS